MLTSTLIFSYQCQDLVRQYYSWPVRMKMTMSQKGPVQFPAVTICNENAFRYDIKMDPTIGECEQLSQARFCLGVCIRVHVRVSVLEKYIPGRLIYSYIPCV